MYGIIEIEDGLERNFYFVSAIIKSNFLIFRDRTNGRNPLNKCIPYTEISAFSTIDVFGKTEITFTFNKQQYNFIEYSHLEISSFHDLLIEKINSLT